MAIPKYYVTFVRNHKIHSGDADPADVFSPLPGRQRGSVCQGVAVAAMEAAFSVGVSEEPDASGAVGD